MGQGEYFQQLGTLVSPAWLQPASTTGLRTENTVFPTSRTLAYKGDVCSEANPTGPDSFSSTAGPIHLPSSAPTTTNDDPVSVTSALAPERFHSSEAQSPSVAYRSPCFHSAHPCAPY